MQFFQSGLLILFSLIISACHSSSSKVENFESGQSAVIGGESVLAGSRASRSVVALVSKEGLCTGTLISNNAILTAAHCVPTQMGTRLVAVFAPGLKGAVKEDARPIVRVYVHPRWKMPNDGKNTGDIAVMKFAGPLPNGYVPVNFLPYSSLVANGSFIFVAGYGNTNGFTGAGSGVLRDTMTVISNAQFSQTEVMVSQTSGRGACNGDSGGPAFMTYQNAFYLWGVVSRGDQNCAKAGIFTNALVYLPWILENLRSL